MVAFPRQSIVWKLEQKTTLQRITLSLPWYGFGIGVVLRLYRWCVLLLIAPEAGGAVLASIGFGVILMCALVTGHLANRSLRSWPWRVPAIAGLVAAGEGATSLVLTLVHQERLGRVLATIGDWPGTAFNILLSRLLIIGVFGLALAGAVAALRRLTDRSEERGGRSEGEG